MTQYAVSTVSSAQRSAVYPAKYYAAHYDGGATMTFMLDADFASLGADVLAIPNFPISSMKASAVTVPTEFFGMSVNQRANDALTGVTAKTVRSHDMAGGKSRWQKIEYADGLYDWVDLDLWVNTHYAAGRDIAFVLFGTPSWATARPSEANAYSSGTYGAGGSNYGIAAEPANLADWDNYCTAIATRYLGKIKYYEVWNEVNLTSFFTGTKTILAQMVRRANQAIKAVDPTAKIISPSIQGWVTTAAGASETYFTGMMSASDGAAATMASWVDIIAVHLYTNANNSYSLNGIIDRINAGKTTAGVTAKETWDTESSPFIPYPVDLTDANLIKLMGRNTITMAARGIARHIYYMYDGTSQGFFGRPAVVTARETLRTLLMSGNMLNASVFTDGRVAYWTSGGVVII
jgi:hypothetical protein